MAGNALRLVMSSNHAFPHRAHEKIARSLRQHRELILNYFRTQKLISSGVVEGLNNKAKVTMRKSCGLRTYRVLELALYHSLGKLPEPISTHDFF
jgi:transposase